MERWKFSDPQNVAVIASKKIATGEAWIGYVTHDDDDGSWQFHNFEGVFLESEVILVSLRSIVQSDPSVELLADLPMGWRAWRDSKGSEWQRERIQEQD